MDQYCVFGNPIKHSRSPYIHQCFAKQTDQQLNYTKKLVKLDQFTWEVTNFIKNGGKGANVTVPFKEQALQLCDQLSEAAKQAGAVNTLTFSKGKIYGDNTDGLGLVQDLLRHDVVIHASRILLLGAGGAARGVILPLLKQNPSNIIIANRTASKAEKLCVKYNEKRVDACGFLQIPTTHFDIIINATSASLSGQRPDISAQFIDKETVCYDMVYHAKLTPFLTWAKQQQAAKVIDGLGMLVSQAAASFRIWRTIQPNVDVVLMALRSELVT